MKLYLPRSLRDDGMVEDIAGEQHSLTKYVTLDDYNHALAEKEKEIVKWQLAHDDMVIRNRLLRDRPDLPIERVRSYDELMQTLAEKDREIDELKKRVQRKPEEWESVCGECDGSGWR